MDRLLFDTNVVLDVLARRAPHLTDSLCCIALARAKRAVGAVTALTLSDASYVCRKQDYDEVLSAFSAMRSYLDVALLNGVIVDNAIRRRLPDFEDGLQWAAARAWKATHLITRNVDDFPRSRGMRIVSPAAYLASRGIGRD